jgi:serine/threonine-protein kinase
LADRYDLVRELGRGGMATVILARDRKHGRDVAIKVLSSELAAGLGSERFLQEIRVAAGLQHPHILGLYDSGKAEDTLYYVMPYVRGESLRERLEREAELPVDDALRILRDVVEALAEAHANGIVHRDIKPDNIMLTSGHAIVADFGVAKAVTDAARGPGGVTTSGVTLGTPSYMAPEQAAADPKIDHRADIYAVGVLAYEMLAGRPVFVGGSPQTVLAAHVSQDPESIGRHRAVPESVEQLVMRCLAKRPADRWQTASELLAAIDAARGSGETIVGAAARAPAGGWRRSGAILVAGIVATAALGIGLFGGGGDEAPPTRPKVGVLPFADANRNPSEEYFGDGLANDIIARLTAVDGMRVVASRTMMTHKGSEASLAEIGRAVGATHVMSGTWRQQGDAISVFVELADVGTGESVGAWSSTHLLDDIFVLQAEIASYIVRETGTVLRADDQQALARPRTTSTEAYRLYLRGRAEWTRRTEVGLRRGLDFFQQAVAIDSNFALAHAAIGDTYAVLADYSTSFTEEDAATLALPAIRRALALDPRLGEAHAALGLIYSAAFDWDAADAAYAEALRLNPGYASAYQWSGLHELGRGDVERAAALLREALDLDPHSLIIHDNVAMIAGVRRDYETAIEFLARATALEPDRGEAFLTLMLLFVGQDRADEFVPSLERIGWAGRPIHTLATEGGYDAVLRLIADGPDTVQVGLRAIVLGELDRLDEAFAALEQGMSEGDWIVRFIAAAPYADPLRGDPRFASVLERMGLSTDSVSSGDGGS